MERDFRGGEFIDREIEEAIHVVGAGAADGVRKGDLDATKVEELPCDVDCLARIDGAAVRASECNRDISPEPKIQRPSAFRHGAEASEGVCPGCAEICLAERVGC